jgi:hypothetical protein
MQAKRDELLGLQWITDPDGSDWMDGGESAVDGFDIVSVHAAPS